MKILYCPNCHRGVRSDHGTCEHCHMPYTFIGFSLDDLRWLIDLIPDGDTARQDIQKYIDKLEILEKAKDDRPRLAIVLFE